ncbi:MAG: MFS transporter [Thermoplasmata archaeon]
MSGEVVVTVAEGPGSPPATGLSPSAIRRSTWILVAVRAGYAYNWFTIGPALPAIGAQFSIGTTEWGLLVGVFLVAAGALQVPAGLLSRRFGSRSVALAGATLLGAASIASGFAPSFAALLALRILAGAGTGLFFSPAIGLIGSLYPEGRRGFPVGTFSSAFSGGAALGVLLSAIAVEQLGWQWDLALGGIGLLVLTAAAVLFIPAAAGAPPRPARATPRVPAALKLRSLWAIGFAFVGLEGASFATGQFIVPYGTSVLGWSAAVAGGVGMAFILASVVGGPVGGVVAERRANRRTQFVVASVTAGVLVALIPWVGLVPMVFLGCVFSFSYGFVYAVMYVLPAYFRELPPEEIPLGIGVFNSIQLAGGALVAWIFGYVVALDGWPVGWSVLAVAAVAPLALLVYVPRTPLRVGARPPDGAWAAPRHEPLP